MNKKELILGVQLFFGIAILLGMVFPGVAVFTGYSTNTIDGFAMGVSTFSILLTVSVNILHWNGSTPSFGKSLAFVSTTMVVTILVGMFVPVWKPLVYTSTGFMCLVIIFLIASYLSGGLKPKEVDKRDTDKASV